MTTKTIPQRACLLRDQQAHLTFADSTGGDAQPTKAGRFSLEPVVSGKVITGHWFWGNLAMDLEGFQAPARSVPALLQHDPNRRLGFTDAFKVKKGVGLTAEGPMLQNADAEAVRQDSAAGFPWQSSAYVEPISIEEVLPGETALANGNEVHGPGTIFRTWRVREVSFAALGADSATNGEAFAAGADLSVTIEERPMTIKKTPAGTEPVPTEPTPGSTALSSDQIQQAHPEAAAAIRLAGATCERDRAAALLAAADPEQGALVAELVKTGVPLADGLARLNADLRERFAQQRQAFAQGAGAPLATPVKPASASAPAALADAARNSAVTLDQFAELCRVEFQADAGLQAEFPDLRVFAAYRRAELRGSFRSTTVKA